MGNYTSDYKSRSRETASDKAKEYYYKYANFVRPFGIQEKECIDVKTFMKFPNKIRKMPDFIIIRNDNFIFVEVKGCHDILRLKQDDLSCYKWWWDTFRKDSKNVRFVFFIYCTFDKLCYELTFQMLIEMFHDNTYETDTYPGNNKTYFKIPHTDISDRCKALEGIIKD